METRRDEPEFLVQRGAELNARRAPEKPGPPADHSDEEDDERTRHRVPDATKEREVQTSPPSQTLTTREDPPQGTPEIHFTVYVPSEDPTGAPVSAGAADISGADSEAGIALHTGNWYIDAVDAGSVTRFDPTSVFSFAPALVGGFCCDQVVIYVPRIDRFVWYMQHSADATGTGGFRLASASPSGVRTNFQTAWTYWDFTADYFGQNNKRLDYPDLAFTDTYLVGTTNVPSAGRVVFRIDLQALAAGGTIAADYTDPAQAPEDIFEFSHLAQHGRTAAFWAGHVKNDTVRIFALGDAGNTYSFKDVGVANWPNGTFSSTGPDGTDWLDAPWADAEISGAARRGDELWLAWTASAGKGTSGGFDFPNPHVRVVAVDVGAWSTLSELQVWNPDYAFAYPFLDVNAKDEVGIMVGWGGAHDNANTAEGILGDFVVWYHNGSDVTPDRFGDFITIRRSGRDGSEFAAFGYFTVKDATQPSGYLFTPYISIFGH